MAKIKPATRERLNDAFKRGFAAGELSERSRTEKLAKLMSEEQAVLDNLGADEGDPGAE